MRIWTAPYTLSSKTDSGLGVGAAVRMGALLKIENRQGGFGYADLHPWPELGDANLREHLSALRDGKPLSLGARSLALAELDWNARVQRKNAFEGLRVPSSHRLIGSVAVISRDFLTQAATDGFTTLKIKIGRDVSAETRALQAHAGELAKFRLRLDANGAFSMMSFLGFLKNLPSELLSALEFIEDPVPLSAWSVVASSTTVPLAIDRVVDPGGLKAGWIIVKPAVQDVEIALAWAKGNGVRVCFTSYLDHPIGQASAALIAAQTFAREPELVGICGLNSHLAFEPNEFSEMLGSSGPEFTPPQGTGIGFDEVLEKQDWRPL